MPTPRLSFKRHPKATGLAGVANPHPHVDIKAGGKLCGTIFPPSPRGQEFWKVSLMVTRDDKPTPESPCPWHRITFKFDGTSEQAARNWVVGHWDRLWRDYKVHQQG